MTALRDLPAASRGDPARGLYAVCSAHPTVLEACMEQALADGGPLLIEATCNQVNQEGGYTGLDAHGFRDLVQHLARDHRLPADRLILGGDHLGPNPWRQLSPEPAMARAERLVASYVAAGFAKIHLDASMALGGERDPLPPELVAARAATLARAAEAAADPAAPPVYVIGTEVPPPGGAREALEALRPTRPEDLGRTLELHRAAFRAAGLEPAWSRVLAVVVQPGVEFGSDAVVDFDPAAAAGLTACLDDRPELVFEAHSTDYQTEAALQALVERRFAVLKVGPGLTFALREALFALAAIEAELLPEGERSDLRPALDAAMQADPHHWQGHLHGTPAEQRLARAFSLSDRCRYYWPVPTVAAAVERLMANLRRRPAPLPLLSQYLPRQHDQVRAGRLANEPIALVRHKVREVAAAYARACGLAEASTKSVA